MSSLYEYFGHQGKGDPGFISLGVKETLGMHFRVSFLRKHMDIYFPFLLLFLCHYSVFGADSRQGSSCSSSGRAEAMEPCEVVKAVKAEDQETLTPVVVYVRPARVPGCVSVSGQSSFLAQASSY